MFTLVLADDEEIERKALGLLLQKEFPDIEIIGLAENGAELVSLVDQNNPDIAIVDINMPGINGIDAIDLMRSRNVDTRFIVNTAYSDFDYVQRALALKVDAYILKPEKRATTIATIRKLCDSIAENRAHSQSQHLMQELFSRIQPVLESELMYSIFVQEPAISSLNTWCEMHALSFHGGAMVTLIPATDNTLLKEQSKSSLRSLIHAILDSSCNCLVSVGESSINMMIFGSEFAGGKFPKTWLSDLLEVLLDKLRRNCNLLMKAGVGTSVEEFSEMSSSYQQSLKVLKEVEKGIVCFWDPSHQAGPDSAQCADFTEELYGLARDGALHHMDKKLEEWNELFIANEALPLQIWQNCQELACENGDAELRAFFRVSRQMLERAGGEQRPELLRQKMNMLTQLLHDNSAGNTYVVQALRIMEENYDRDLSLESVAQQINISSFYLSRLLKAALGHTFVEYLTQIRIQEAVRLACTTRLSIREIAERTGYSNPTYFCRVLKRSTGKTIGEIRAENRG